MGITGIVFTLGFFATLVMSFTRHPRYGLYAYLAAFYVHPPSRWWGASLPDLRWSLLAAAVTLIALWKAKAKDERISWSSTTPGKTLILFTIWIWIQSAWALDSQMHSELAVLYTKYIVLFYLIYKICDSPEEIERFLLAHVVGCFYLGYLAFSQPVSGRLEGVGGPGIDEANALAMQLATAVMCGAMFVLSDRGPKLYVSIFSMAFILNGIVLCGSRGAFLSVIAGGLVLHFMKPKAHRVLFYALSTLGLMLFLIVANESFWQRISTIGAAVNHDEQMDNSAESRFVIVEAQTRMAAKYPMGTGHRGTEILSREYIDEKYLTKRADGTPGARASHNTFMTALVEQGIPGAIVFVIFTWWSIKAARQLKRASLDFPPKTIASIAAISGALMVVLIAGIFVDYLKAEVQIWLFALLASMHSYVFKNKQLASIASPTQVTPALPNQKNPRRRNGPKPLGIQ